MPKLAFFVVVTFVLTASGATNTDQLKSGLGRAAFSGGSYLRLRDAFRACPGVVKARIGYVGGFKHKPTYKEVCSGATGHAEAVEVVFNTKVVTFEAVLDCFFNAHDATKMDLFEGYAGTQFRSGIFTRTQPQHAAAMAAVSKRPDAKTAISPPHLTGVFWYEREVSDDVLLRILLRSQANATRMGETDQPTSRPPPTPTIKSILLPPAPAQTSVDEGKWSTPLAPIPEHYPRRYIVFEPWVGGPNNRRISLEFVLFVATLVNRTVILPPLSGVPDTDMVHGQGDREIGFEHVYDMVAMKKHLAVLNVC
jgi:peptide-methionine (S)-S-oxide reductase